MKEASIEELKEVVSEDVAKRLYQALHERKEENNEKE